jgi:hypothetical protein
MQVRSKVKITREDKRLIDKKVYNNLPNILKEITEPFDGNKKDVVLLSTLGVLSSAIPNVYGIYSSARVYSNLYILIIAPPASGKGVMNHSRYLIEPVHKKLIKEHKEKVESATEGSKKTPLSIKLIPANISSADIYQRLKYAHHSGLMMESEADTLSVMFKKEFGNFSDVLRKAFHHEPISISRKTDDFFMEIENAKLSLVLSGTPDQVKPLIQSKENGLFSRFAYYMFNDSSQWEDVFKDKIDYNKYFLQFGKKEVFSLYNDLASLKNEIEFEFTDKMKIEFHKRMSYNYGFVLENHPEIFTSNVKRHGLILFRIAMILNVLRNTENINNTEKLICSKTDFETAYSISNSLLHNALSVLKLVDGNLLDFTDNKILNDLGKDFERKDAVEMGKFHQVAERTIDYKLAKWVKEGVINKIKNGEYIKV